MLLKSWNHISDCFKNGNILLGNGASIAINSNFNYSLLYKNALLNNHINDSLNQVFNHLTTKDFELVLRMLWHSNAINQALQIPDNMTTEAYQAVRTALINSVRDNHPQNIEDTHLLRIARFLKSFRTVISLNYDLLVYWAVNKSNNDNKETWFKDCWINSIFQEDWRDYRKPYQSAEDATLVFYPHGNLILASRLNGKEEKIAKNREQNLDLRETIINRWNTGEYIPLFVSEGTSDHKKDAIERSNYLRIVYDEVLPSLKEKLVIFGWSMSDQDTHILEAINKANPKKLAISIYVNNSDIEQKCQEYKDKLRRQLSGNPICYAYPKLNEIADKDIYFFDSSSPDFWINDGEDNDD